MVNKNKDKKEKRFKANKKPGGGLEVVYKRDMDDNEVEYRKKQLQASIENYKNQIKRITEMKELAEEELSVLISDETESTE